MIVVPFLLASAQTGKTTNRGTIVIDNISGTNNSRNYRVRAFAKGADRLGTVHMLRNCQPIREATITGHNSPREPVWALMAKALEALGYG